MDSGIFFILSFFLFRILLNYFKWDKEKLMEKYFSDEQDAMFTEAHVVSPYRSAVHDSIPDVPGTSTLVRTVQQIGGKKNKLEPESAMIHTFGRADPDSKWQCCGSGYPIRCLFDPWIRDG
jgi:hypothetical protein